MNGPPPKTSGTQPSAEGQFRVRPARRGDADSIRQLLIELGYPEGADTHTVHWIISHPEMEIFVAADPMDRPVGMLALSHRPQLRLKGRIVTIDELIVTSAWRRKGVGQKLIQRALERAKVLSARRIEVSTHGAHSPGAPGFLEAAGFKSDGVPTFFLAVAAK